MLTIRNYPASLWWIAVLTWTLTLPLVSLSAAEHPMGYITPEIVKEIRDKYQHFEWAQKIVENHKSICKPWVERDIDSILKVIPQKRVGVYHLFTCPETKVRLTFSPFEDDNFRSPETGKVYRAEDISPVYERDSPYYGTYYDGWGCLFVMYLFEACYRSGLLYQVLEEPEYAEWVSRVLVYYADEVVPHLTVENIYGQNRTLTYAREGDAIYLNNMVMAYELVRDAGFLSDAEKDRVENQFFRVICDRAIMEDEYHFDHNDLPHYLCVVMNAGIAINEPRYLEFAFGYGDYVPEKRPEHRSLAYMIERHFHDDGAHLDVCSGYHLYAATPFYRNLFIGHNLSRSDPQRFPPERFDFFSERHPKYDKIQGVARWASAMAAFDGSLPTVGDSMAATASCMTYDPFGEIAYRYCGFRELGLEEPIVKGARPDNALIVGASTIVTEGIVSPSANLASGYAVVKQNGVYMAMNALIPGGGHQHADRLNLLIYANDRLMGMEKATPYNDLSLRDHSTFSWAHNTVAVDRKSQPQGESLKPEHVPAITQFLDTPAVSVVRGTGDRLYANTEAYDRTVFRVGTVFVDLFHVKGGEVHDYIYHNYGEAFETNVTLNAVDSGFDAPEYLVGGKPNYETADVRDRFQATWKFPAVADSVYPLRRHPAAMVLTLLQPANASASTTIFHLWTHPYEQHKPYTHTVVARRQGPENTFVALLESTLDGNALTIQDADYTEWKDGNVKIKLTLPDRTVELYNLHNPAALEGTVLSTDAEYAIVEYAKDQPIPRTIVLGAGTYFKNPSVEMKTDERATTVLNRVDRSRWTGRCFESVQYVTRGAGNQYSPQRTIHGEFRLTDGQENQIPFIMQTVTQDNAPLFLPLLPSK